MTPGASPVRVDAVVVGAGMAGLTAAHALVAAGVRPLVLEAGDGVGGLVTGGTVGGVELDLGAEAFALRRPEVGALARSLGLAVEQPAGGSWVSSSDGGRATPIPAESILGIPADPGSPDVVAALGAEGAARAARDAELAPEVGADATDLAALVRARMGEAVLERLVRPVAGGIHNADPADLVVDAVAPGLRAALVRHGSLAAAVRALRAAAPPGAAVATTSGGLFRLPRALAAAVTAAGGQVRTGSAVTGLRRAGATWEVRVAGEAGVRADTVVLAAPAGVALGLLGSVLDVSHVALSTGSAITHATLVVRAPELDAAPRGAGLLVAPGPGPVRAKALTHASAKWRWLAEATPPGVHVLRLSYGRPGEDLAGVDAALALRDAAALLGVPLQAGQVLDARVVHREGALAAATPAHRDQVAALVARTDALPGLGLAGAWVAGTGLAAVVPHAQEVAARLARRASNPSAPRPA
ncbi:NAD(P)/FAD-dependent oxidoreductase [Georgenia sp. SYP-B2076]|uniref:protoporphyrinogen/coproporphyrinogen oxidase n=1 Tax=Georgenia sp. SYP-B2076 TaxID=2495881 RepID=UPI001F0C0DB6|nr:FAD-dependent oxidoreductase [Georgenia sp. SYP-B2076]